MNRTIVKPKALNKGQVVGLVAPASHFDDDERIDIAVETLESFGFSVKESENLRHRHGYFAGTDLSRANGVNAMFLDPNVAAVVCLTGGWGSSRILPFLDYELIRKNPKVILGFSDITAIINGIHTKTGLVTFHGPVADTEFSPYSAQALKQIVMHAKADIFLGNPPPYEKEEGRVQRKNRVGSLFPGVACGSLVGGNLTLISHLIGTDYLPSFEDKILFLEDINEQIYRIDRMLTQLWLSGQLKGVAGLVFGKFIDCLPSSNRANQFTLAEVLSEFSQKLGVPAIKGLMIGHISDQATLPIGCQVELDANSGTLRLLEAAVV